jgi:hypothetical protein
MIEDVVSWKDRYFRGKREPSTLVSCVAIIFIIAALLIWGILSLVEPSWCKRNETCLDNSKVFGASIVLAFIVAIIVVITYIVISHHNKRA